MMAAALVFDGSGFGPGLPFFFGSVIALTPAAGRPPVPRIDRQSHRGIVHCNLMICNTVVNERSELSSRKIKKKPEQTIDSCLTKCNMILPGRDGRPGNETGP